MTKGKCPSQADLRHMVALCSEKDVVAGPASIEILRPPVFEARAAIEPKRGQTWSRLGVVAHDETERPSHEITIRFRPDVDITKAAWLYEERLQSGRRWFKILDHYDVGERARFWCLSCRLVERGVAVPGPTEPSAGATAKKSTLPSGQQLPPGVKL